MKKQSAISYLIQTAGKSKIGIALLVIIQIIQGICSICYALFLRNIINSAVAADKKAFWLSIIYFASLFLLQLCLTALRRHFDESVKSQLENNFKQRLFKNLLNRDYSVVSSVHSGELMNRLTNDTVVISNAMAELLPGLCGMAVRLLGAGLMILILERRFLYIVVPGGLLLIATSAAFRKIMKRMHKQIQEKDGALRSFLQEALSGMLVVRSYAVQDDILDESKKRMTSHKKARMKRNRFSIFCNFGFGFIMQGASVLGAVFCGYGILTGAMNYGTFTAVLTLIGQVQAPFANISGFLPRYYAMVASAERLMEIEQAAGKEDTASKTLDDILTIYRKSFEKFGLENAKFTYLARSQNLSDNMDKDAVSPIKGEVSLQINKGDYVAFTGPSGCGKSTLLKLLMCIYPLDGGERFITLDGKKTKLTGEYQRLFAYVPQGNHLMSGSIRDIVAFAEPSQSHDENRLRYALKAACADFVFDLDDGADTVLGERGTGLSEGQMQRIAIARAIFSKRPVLMLDECTSALDETTERELLKNLREMTNATVIIITHKTAALEICDKTIRFNEGCKIEEIK